MNDCFCANCANGVPPAGGAQNIKLKAKDDDDEGKPRKSKGGLRGLIR